MKTHQWLLIGILGVYLPVTAFAQSQYVDIGRFFFSLSPKVLEDGSITDMSLGYSYTEKYAGELRFRFSNETKNEQFDETIPDSLNAIEERDLEVFFLPIEYFPVRNASMKFQAGAGVYYVCNKLTEKGFFNMPILESQGKERVNSFSNDFSMHVVGPDVEMGFMYQTGRINVTVHGGIVPIFLLHARQKMSIVPLLDPNHAEYSQNTWGSPYFYVDAGVIIFKYVSLALLYDFSRLNYAVIDFDDDLKWYHPGREVVSQSLKMEASILIPLQGSVYTQIGYGHTLDFMRFDSASPIQSNKPYLIFSAKVIK
ncbi:MAG: hypothetical protein LBK62_04245 [Treponema sp.]|jgi:hypothetical protein|nr:hypothetical protein [Treponema sp.]